MYFTYTDLVESIELGDHRIKNYFDTFGFVVIKNVLSKSDFKNANTKYKRFN